MHAEAGLMAAVDEIHEVLRRAEARSGRVVADHLIAPRTGERMLHHRQQFQVRVAHADGVFHQLVGQLAIAQIRIVRAAQPGAEMDFVDGDGLLQMVFMSARVHPLLVVPLIRGEIANDGGGLRRHFHGEAVGIGLLLAKAARRRTDRILVVGARANSRKEDFPDAAGAQPHGMPALVPIVEVADYADHFGIGRPHRKANALHAQAFDQVSAHGAVALILRAFAVDVQIEIGDQAGKSVRVLDVGVRAVPEREMQLVISRIVPQRGDEESFGARLAHGMRRAIRDHRGVHGLRKERAYFPAIRRL